jgi:hypothetical protein
MSKALLPKWCQQEIYSPTTEYGVSFTIPCTTFLHQFFDEYNNTKIYIATKNFPITLCAVLLLDM